MNCVTYALLGIGLVGGSFATLSVSEKQHDKLRAIFSDDLDIVYNKIILERRNHYIQGLVLGLVLAYITLYSLKITKVFYKVAVALCVTMFVGASYYMLMPKSDYILNHLKTPDQTAAWLEMYKTMKMRYIVGFFIGLAAAIPIANAYC